MALIPQISNGESGLSVRQKINQSMRTVETDSTLTGNGSASLPLSVVISSIESAINTYEVISIDNTDSPYTVVKSKPNTIILADTTAAVISILLEPAANWSGVITVKCSGSGGNDVTVTPDGAETIDGDPSLVISDLQSFDLFNDESNVWIK